MKDRRKPINVKSFFMFPVSKVHPVLPLYSSHHLAVSNCPRWYRKQRQRGSFCCQNTLILHKGTVGTYKELRKKNIQLQKDASNFFTILAEELMLSGAELLLTQHFASVLPVTWLTKFVNPILQSPTTRKLFAVPSK